MKRLTKRLPEGAGIFTVGDVQKLVARLAEIEDILGDDYDIKWLKEAASYKDIDLIAYKKAFEKISLLPTCNTCADRDCKFRPNVGQVSRFNSPLWKEVKKSKTRAQVFFEKFPDAPKHSDGRPRACAKDCGLTDKCRAKEHKGTLLYCIYCWQEPASDKYQEWGDKP